MRSGNDPARLFQRGQYTPALFVVVEKVTPDKAVAALSKYGGTVLKTSLSDEQTAKLQDALHGTGSVVSA